MIAKIPSIIRRVQSFLESYMEFPSPDYALACALWSVGTYFWGSVDGATEEQTETEVLTTPGLDVFPSLSSTADTKRAGKTRLNELMAMVCRNPRSMSAMTPATVYRSFGPGRPTSSGGGDE